MFCTGDNNILISWLWSTISVAGVAAVRYRLLSPAFRVIAAAAAMASVARRGQDPAAAKPGLGIVSGRLVGPAESAVEILAVMGYGAAPSEDAEHVAAGVSAGGQCVNLGLCALAVAPRFAHRAVVGNGDRAVPGGNRRDGRDGWHGNGRTLVAMREGPVWRWAKWLNHRHDQRGHSNRAGDRNRDPTAPYRSYPLPPVRLHDLLPVYVFVTTSFQGTCAECTRLMF